MVRPVFSALFSFIFLIHLVAADASNAQYVIYDRQSVRDTDTFVSLVQQSHDIDNSMPPPVRARILTRQTEMISYLKPALSQEWSNELFALSLQVQGSQRSEVQSSALSILVRLDPDRSLDLLHQLGKDDAESKSAIWPPKTLLAQKVFNILAMRDGEKALPVLQQEAELMGLQGHYPYAALGYSTMQVANKYWAEDNPRAIRILESVFQPAVARYSHAPRTYSDDYEFGGMLQALAGGLPVDSVQPALRLLVKNLLATDTSKYQFEAEVTNYTGQKAAVHNAIDAAILNLGSLVNRDPELARELESSRPQLQKALEFLRVNQSASMTFGPVLPAQQGQPAGEDEMFQDTVRLALSNPEGAIAMAEKLSGDSRTVALLQVARMVSRYNPERAAAVIDEIRQDRNTSMDEETFVDVSSAEAFVAAGRNDQEALHDALRNGFASANHILLEQQRIGRSGSIPALTPLVHIGMEKDPNFTITFVEALPASRAKAEVLLDAAAALARP
jgi:hypothetical protein